MFKKICKDPRCRKEFESESRNAAFCCKECQQRYYKERKKRRVKYADHREENSVVSKAYRLANEVADLFYPEKVCCKCGAAATHVHHRSLNIFDNSPENLERVCEKCHKQIHSPLPDVNMIDVLSECISADNKLEVFNERVLSKKEEILEKQVR